MNDKAVIQSLTEIAGIGYDKAREIVHIIVHNENSEGLLKLYLVDSIIKKVGGSYINFFSEDLVDSFASVFKTADTSCRGKLFKLRQTWNGLVSESTLNLLDIGVNNIDRNWPILLDQVSVNLFSLC